ncbi:MAG: phage terminase large subunit family protein [Syntrophobacteraceae bacterium]
MWTDAGVDFLEGFLPEEVRVWEPPERLSISEWADRHRVLDSATSPEPGPWRTDRTPYARAWMDGFNDPEIEVLAIQTGKQIAKTETLLNVIGFIVDQQPGPCMVVSGSMRIWRAAVDTGGGNREDGLSMTEDTTNWLRRNGVGRGCRVWATKGSSTPLAGNSMPCGVSRRS